LARAHTEAALRTLCGIMVNGDNETARVTAAVHILDRGWGKPAQTHTGADGEGAIQFTVRHILESAAAPGRTIEHASIDAAPSDAGEE
jgi:hypothetical protein